HSSRRGGRRGIRYSGVERDQLRVTAAVEGHPSQQGLIDETGFSAGRTFFSAPFAVRGAFSSVLRPQLHYGQEKLQCQKSKSVNQLTVEWSNHELRYIRKQRFRPAQAGACARLFAPSAC